MDVTKSNFQEILNELDEVISSSEFIAIDGEFTGINSGGPDINAFDTPAQYYNKHRKSGMNFLLIQFGMCAFIYDEKRDKYLHKAYNFFVFPRPANRAAYDHRFLCQSSSIDFLASNGFDFNKLFRDGIPYLSHSEEQRLRERLEEKQKMRMDNTSSNDTSSDFILIPDEYVNTIDEVCVQIKEFLEKDDEEELVLEKYNSFVRKLIYQTVEERFDKNEVTLESRVVENRNRVLVVTKAKCEEERKKKEEQQCKLEWNELNNSVGFSSVIRMLSQSEKLIIGHNMLLDVCHVLHQFCTPLPESYFEFKELVSCVFPRIIDTKYMSSSPPFKDYILSTVLCHMLAALSEKPFSMVKVEPADRSRGYELTDDKSHEAGFDAFVTGICFITMCNYLGSKLLPPVKTVLPSSSNIVKPYLNKLFLMKVQDFPYINISGKDPNPPRDHVFHISFSKDWKTQDIQQLFSPFGNVFVAWINDTSAYVALQRRDQSKLVLMSLPKSSTYVIKTYEQYQASVDDRETCIQNKQSIKESPKRKVEYSRNDLVKRARTESSNFAGRTIDTIPEEQDINMDDKDNAVSTNDNVKKSKKKKKSAKVFEESDDW